MWLLIDVKGIAMPDWEGFNFLVNGRASSETETSVEVCTGGWQWKQVGTVKYRDEGNQLHVAVPKRMLGIRRNSFAIEFKWIDNTQSPGDIMDAYINGDAAPGGRFRYRYDTQ